MDHQLVRLLALISILFINANAQAVVPTAERNALLELYSSTVGDAWHSNTNWLGAAGTECSWYGVSCSTDGNSIISLNLKSNNLRGPLPDSLANLSKLSSTDLRFNALYTDSQSLIDFIDASGPVGSILDTQTQDVSGIHFSNVAASELTINWNPVAYAQAGGYRVYLAQQINEENNIHLSEFIQVGELTDKSITTFSLGGLAVCTQYFVKVTSYTNIHDDNGAELESDGKQNNIIGTITNYSAGCDSLVFYSPGTLSLNVEYDPDLTESSVLIEIASANSWIYTVTEPGVAPETPAEWCIGNNVIIGTPPGGNSDLEKCIDNDVIIGTELEFGFYPMLTAGVLHESTEVGTVIFTVQAHDPNGELLSYSIMDGNINDTFSINSDGQISLIKPLDPLVVGSYKLTAQVRNISGQEDTVTLNFSVLNLNDIGSLMEENKETPTDENEAGGCTIQPGAAFDPIWLFIFVLAGVYQIYRLRSS